MDTLLGILDNDAAITLIATIIGTVWAAFRASDWFQSRKAGRVEKALLCLEHGVETTYQTYVRGLKQANEDGKLTDAERTAALNLAIESASAYARQEGLDLALELGRERLAGYIEAILRNVKIEAAQAKGDDL
jgi:hypothetical protein